MARPSKPEPKPARLKIRSRHEGSAHWDASRQRWRAWVELDGRRRAVTGTSEADALARVAALRAAHTRGLLQGNASNRGLTVAAYLTDWLQTKLTLRPRAWTRLESDVRVHLIPALGHLRLADLRPEHLERLYVRLHTRGGSTADGSTGKPLAARSIRNVHRAAFQALARAVEHGHLERNPATAAESVLPRPPARPLRALTREQTDALLAAAAGHRYESLLIVKSELGCRIGELLGLTWPAVDWVRGTVAIVQQFVPSPVSAPEFAEPKSASGLRTLYLTARARRALEAQREIQAADRLLWQASPKSRWDSGPALVFTTPWGTPILEQNVARALHRLCERAGLPAGVTPHWLRHTAATRMAHEGVDFATIAAVLGHSGGSGLVASTYAHALDDSRRDAALRLDRSRAATAAAGSGEPPGRAAAG